MKKLTYFVIFLMIAALLLAAFQRQPMAIDFDGTGTDQIDFATGAAGVKFVGAKTVMAWVYQDTYVTNAGGGGRIFSVSDVDAPFTDNSYAMRLNYAGNGDVAFVEVFSTQLGLWRTTSAGLVTTGGWHHVAVVFDNTSDANNPVFYVDAVSAAVTEVIAPSGSAFSGTDGQVSIGGNTKTSESGIDGRITDVRVYNRALSASEIADIYAARTYGDNINGLVFNPVLYGSAVSAFDGATLSTSNKIIDPYTLAQGTPQGSPVGVGETYLRLK